MSNDQIQRDVSNGRENHGDGDQVIRDIHALTPPPAPAGNRARQRESWETSSHRLSTLSMSSDGASSENFTSMSREFNALVLAGSAIGNADGHENEGGNVGNNLARIGEDDRLPEVTNPLAIVLDNNPLDPVPSPRHPAAGSGMAEEVSLQRVKREEIESKISAWQTAKIAKINNRFKREDAIVNGWEDEQVQKATSWMKKVEKARG
uniref:Remorin C-terminal domain-containing protein n=1 Tax=Nelumbo nucifera TaxID=4432 RepID=A0A822YBR2_NELNU|nr:TPA_asm: hypothetical protein HUJ06_031220 [Nelumbo nucifera]